MICETCDTEKPHFRWTDTHGVAVCGVCGTPYRLYHYEGDTRVEKAPEPMLNDVGMAIARQYWGERKRMVFPACYDMGMERDGRTYSGASREDCGAFSEWADAHPTLFPTSGETSDGGDFAGRGVGQVE